MMNVWTFPNQNEVIAKTNMKSSEEKHHRETTASMESLGGFYKMNKSYSFLYYGSMLWFHRAKCFYICNVRKIVMILSIIFIDSIKIKTKNLLIIIRRPKIAIKMHR